jgi:glycosyltransferase involved in cell wall biosynthesis
MKITLLHPSRGRAKKAKETYDYWVSQSSGEIEIEHILSLDRSDSANEEYYKEFDNTGSLCLLKDNACVVEATNKAAKEANGDILVYMSDDFKCPLNWDIALENYFKGVKTPMLLKVDDCLQQFHIPVLTIPIMNRALYEKLGYFWHPGYKSMFVDEDLFWTVTYNNWIVNSPGLKFPHEHCCNGKAENDETYKRSAANWDQGKAMFAKRRLEGFPL